MTIATNYDPIAPFYDRHWTDRYQPSAFQILSEILLNRLPPGSSMLDVGCGTGAISEKLVEQGYQVVGIDVSLEMVKCARQRVHGGIFAVADIRHSHFRCRFDAVISLFDTLNHVLSSEEMLATFQNIHGVLKPSRTFMFDLNMEEAYETQWDQWSAHVYPDEVCIVRGSYDRQAKLGHTEITLFTKSSGWQRSDLYLRQRCYQQEEVSRLMRLARFRSVQVDTATNLGMRDDDLAAGRRFSPHARKVALRQLAGRCSDRS